MVKVGFIVEGDTEKILIESDRFKSFAKNNGIEVCSPVIDAKGGGNLLPHNIHPSIARLKMADVDHIVILTDLDTAPDVETVKTRIGSQHTQLIFVAVKAIEAWFLADTHALRRWLKMDSAFEASPETTPGMPWDRLKTLAIEMGARGPGHSKPIFARNMCKQYGFDLAQAAQHPACPSARIFHDALVNLGGGQPSVGKIT